jgi:hypothetical protein
MSAVAESRERGRTADFGSSPRAIERDHKTTIGTFRVILKTVVNWRGRSSPSLPDGTVLVASSRRPFLEADAVDDQLERPNVHRRKCRSDGLFAVDWADDADGPFEGLRFAEAVAVREGRPINNISGAPGTILYHIGIYADGDASRGVSP